jgi:hypothetical protein
MAYYLCVNMGLNNWTIDFFNSIDNLKKAAAIAIKIGYEYKIMQELDVEIMEDGE